ncbi:TPA: hypothetical protein ACH3X1_013242 [Trebouxia sp. C0004]
MTSLASPLLLHLGGRPAEPVDTAAAAHAEMILNQAWEFNMPIGPLMQELLGPVPIGSAYKPIGGLRFHFLALCLLHNPTWTTCDFVEVAEHVVNAFTLGRGHDVAVWIEVLIANHHPGSLGSASAGLSQLSALQSQELQQQQELLQQQQQQEHEPLQQQQQQQAGPEQANDQHATANRSIGETAAAAHSESGSGVQHANWSFHAILTASLTLLHSP